MDKKSLEFTVFVIHALADDWNKPYRKVYQILNESGILDSYILPCYHTVTPFSLTNSVISSTRYCLPCVCSTS